MEWTRTALVSAGRLDKLVNLIGHLTAEVESRQLGGAPSRLVEETLRTLAGLETFPFQFLKPETEAIAKSAGARSGKKIEVSFEGAAIEVPLSLREMLSASLLHLVRNSLAHGIESPAVRESSGKPATGRLRVRARVIAGELEVRFGDDGAGPDLEAVVRKAIQAGEFPQNFAERLTSAQKLEFLFRPGLSTAETITELSGRGVGLDAVAKSWSLLGGRVQAEIPEAGGFEIVMRAPLSQFAQEARRVKVGDGTFWIPVQDLASSVPGPQHLKASRIAPSRDLELGPCLGDQYLPLLQGEKMLALPCREVNEPEFRSFRSLDPSWAEGGADWIRAWTLRFPRSYASITGSELAIFAPAEAWVSSDGARG